jgi:hypothetical protein
MFQLDVDPVTAGLPRPVAAGGAIVPGCHKVRHTIAGVHIHCNKEIQLLLLRPGPKMTPAGLVNTTPTAILKLCPLHGGNAEERLSTMFNAFVFAILSGMVGLIAYEIFSEISGSSNDLHDRYHE